MPQSTFAGIAFRRGEKRLKWQGLDACLPWQWSEKREGEPPHATGFDKMTATGVSRVTIDPASVRSFGPNGVLWCHQGRRRLVPLRPDLSRDVGEVFRQLTRFPLGAIENLVEGTEGFALGVTRNPQARRYGSLARCQQSAHRKNARIPPGWLREGGTERVQSMPSRNCGTASPDSVERSTCFMMMTSIL